MFFTLMGYYFQPFGIAIPLYCDRCDDVFCAELTEPVHIFRTNDVVTFGGRALESARHDLRYVMAQDHSDSFGNGYELLGLFFTPCSISPF